ncbi:beta-ketoacyl-ACP reductase [Halalkalibacillus sediminis]|uniref:Beta-ketoacyl-ACP reductase n=1 Tax=Halalkalibacillus sediminis TaxID=2018042 RepID=A0A2I0QU97_9BACI|nr:3-oxoacyl-ACP reductase FabG [Halalkalibacillus sediminis]PKR77896.1 beta-ketoacyl-ACP reductase [Halalkalibacillus sediminis]
MMKTFEGMIAIVTGAARGIGLEIARTLGQNGANVYILDLDEVALNEASEFLSEENVKHDTRVMNVTDEKQVSEVIDGIGKKNGTIDILVNNAGITRDNLLFKMNVDEWESVMDVHLKGAFLCTKYAQRWMVENKYGRIINLSSASALGNQGQANYAAAKAGMQGFTKTLALELGKFNITANAVAPGFIETEMTKAVAKRLNISYEELKSEKVKGIAVRRTGSTEDIAHAVEYFAHPKSSFVSGQVLYVAGGPKN